MLLLLYNLVLLIKQKNPQRPCFFYNAAPNNLSYLMALETGCYSTLNWQGDISTITMRWRSSRHSQCSISDCSSGTAIQDLSFTRILLKSDIFSLYLWSDLESLLHSDCTKPYNFTKSEISSSIFMIQHKKNYFSYLRASQQKKNCFDRVFNWELQFSWQGEVQCMIHN